MYVRVEKVGRAGGRRVRCIAPWPGIELAEGKGEGIACRKNGLSYGHAGR